MIQKNTPQDGDRRAVGDMEHVYDKQHRPRRAGYGVHYHATSYKKTNLPLRLPPPGDRTRRERNECDKMGGRRVARPESVSVRVSTNEWVDGWMVNDWMVERCKWDGWFEERTADWAARAARKDAATKITASGDNRRRRYGMAVAGRLSDPRQRLHGVMRRKKGATAFTLSSSP